MKQTSFFMPINKRDEEKRLVWGYASTEAVDSDGEIITKESMQEAIDDYMRFGNIREMHQHIAAGKVKEAEFDDKGLYICAKVVDDQAWEKVKEGVYNGFSIGGEATARIGNQITGMKLIEISLVDRPANPECLFEVFKVQKPTIKKSFSTISKLANVVQEIAWMRDEVKFEEEFEQDTASVLPGMMDEALDKLGEILLAMSAEEIAESKPEGAQPMAEKIQKAEAEKDELAERKKACKEELASRMKAHKDEMDEMEAMHKAVDEHGEKELDELEAKLDDMRKDHGGEHEEDEEMGEEKKKGEKEEARKEEAAKTESAKEEVKEEAQKVAKAVKLATDRAIAKAQKREEELSSLIKMNKELLERVNVLEKGMTAPRALKAVEKNGKESELPIESIVQKAAKGEMSQSEAFKNALALAPRTIIH